MILAEYTLEKEDLYEKFTQEEIFSVLFGFPIEKEVSYLNPLRDDKTPGCKFFDGNDGDVLFIDYSRGESYNWYTFAREYYGLTAHLDILKRVAQDLGILPKNSTYKIPAKWLKQTSTKKNKGVHLVDIKVKISPIKKVHFDYWSTFDFEFTVDHFIKYRILPFYYYIMQFSTNQYTVEADPIGFIYYLTPDKKDKQVYMPFTDKKRKFRQKKNSHIFGWENAQKEKGYIVLTKSYKDYVICQLAGINAICILAEGYSVTLQDYAKMKSYGKVYTLFDPDNAGIKRSNDLQKLYKTTPIFLSKEVKDAYGHFKKFGLKSLSDTLTKLLS